MNEAERNAEVVRRGYAAFNSGDMETLTELFDESASWHTPGRGRLAGDHAAAVGRASNAKWLWRLALKRFGELNAMDAPAAKAVAENLRVAS